MGAEALGGEYTPGRSSIMRTQSRDGGARGPSPEVLDGPRQSELSSREPMAALTRSIGSAVVRLRAIRERVGETVFGSSARSPSRRGLQPRRSCGSRCSSTTKSRSARTFEIYYRGVQEWLQGRDPWAAQVSSPLTTCSATPGRPRRPSFSRRAHCSRKASSRALARTLRSERGGDRPLAQATDVVAPVPADS